LIDLSQASGLSLQIDDEGKLHFDPGVIVEDYRVRILDELAPVYLDQEACRGQTVAYEMFNGVYAAQDIEKLDSLLVRYELTLFPALKVGREYIKTLGHIHLPDPRSGIDHPEICEVVTGRAHFLFFQLNPDFTSASEAFFVEVSAGQKIIIPPGYDHLTINPCPGVLLFSDVVALGVRGNYERIKAASGAPYLEVDDFGAPVFIANPHYKRHPPLRQVRTKDLSAISLPADIPLYTSYVGTSAKEWDFLWQPELYQARFPSLDDIFSPYSG
jgi:glucose-6-phosphate isomerase